MNKSIIENEIKWWIFQKYGYLLSFGKKKNI